MRNLLRQRIRLLMPSALVVLLAVAMACGAPGAPAENSPPPAATQSQALVVATAVPQQPAQPSAASEQPTAPPAAAGQAATVADPEVVRPTLNAGVIWLSTPLDPAESGWVANQSGMSENLFRLSASDLGPEPWLATGATQIDPLTWEIGIRSGVVFHNGKAMDAQAVKDSLERTVRLSEGSAESLAIDSIAVKDEQTIIVTISEPRPTLPGLLTTPAVAITDAAAADAAGEGNFIDAGALTGPYMPTHYVIEERLETVAYDDYWGGRPPLAGINQIAIPDTNSRELALQAGDVDVVINLSPEGVQVIEAEPGLRVATAGDWHVGCNVVGQLRA